MTTAVYLVRHGSHDRLGRVLCGRTPGVRLSERGRAEVALAGRRLAGETIAAVYSSPLERAQETAEIIGQGVGLTVQTEEAVNEIDFGDWNGRTFADLDGDDRWRGWNTERARARPPNGESIDEVRARLRTWLDHLRRSRPEQRIVAVSHQDVIKTALCDALGLSMDRHMSFEISPASVSIMLLDDRGARVHSINEAGL